MTTLHARRLQQPDGSADRTPQVLAPYVWAVTRLAMSFVFLWPFADKLVGLGKATPGDAGWLDGGSPTAGYLSSLEGTFADTFSWMAGDAWADWLFMVGLLGIGVALLLGIGMRIAAVSGALLLLFMWMASLPLENNPFLDDHLVYGLVLIGLAASGAGDTWGLGRAWSSIGLVQRFPALR